MPFTHPRVTGVQDRITAGRGRLLHVRTATPATRSPAPRGNNCTELVPVDGSSHSGRLTMSPPP